MAQAKTQIWRKPCGWIVAKDAIRGVPRNLKYAWFGVDTGHRRRLAAAALLLPPAVLAYVWGALSTEKPFARLLSRRETGAAGAG